MNSLSKFFAVRPNDQVTLQLTIGYGQVADTTVFLGGQKIAEGKKDSFQLALSGTGTDLNRKMLFCSTVVSDIRKETNKTAVTYTLTGGINDFKGRLQEVVKEEGGTAVYTATFTFFLTTA